MFRVKTDFATKTSYAELTPMEESPALYSLSESAQIVSAVLTAMLTAMSSASVYSQDSWKSESSSSSSPFFPVVKVDPRRMAIAFSPSVQWQWADMAAEGDSDQHLRMESPLVCSTTFISQPDVSSSEVNEVNDTKAHSEADVVPSIAVHDESVGSFLDIGTPSRVQKRLTKVKSKSMRRESAKRPKSAFQKVMFLFQPSKRELAQLGKADAIVISDNLSTMDFRLPEFRVSPILYSFIDQVSTSSPSALQMPGTPSPAAPSLASFGTLVEKDDEDTGRVSRLRATMPPPPKKGHRRYRSSPAVPYFPPQWDKANMPPLPPMPAGPLKPILLIGQDHM